MNLSVAWSESASDVGAPLPHNSYQDNLAFRNQPQPPQQHRGGDVSISNGSYGRSLSTDRRKEPSLRDAKHENQIWISVRAASQSVQEVVNKTGMTERAVHNIRARRSKINFDNLVEWMKNDQDFAASLFEYVGLLRPGEAEFVAAFTKATNAYLQMKGNR